MITLEICKMCSSSLISAYEFVKNCIEVDHMLKLIKMELENEKIKLEAEIGKIRTKLGVLFI